MQSATPQISTPPPPPKQDEGLKTPPPQTPGKNTSRGASGKSTLETVQENSTDDVREPSPAAVKAAADLRPLTRLSEDDDAPGKREKNTVETEKHTQPGESGSESAGAKSTKQKAQSSDTYRPKSTHTKSYTPLSSAKSRQSEGKQNMTVETETVPSIPQSALSTGERSGGGRVDLNGSVRLKPSNETIRPKKERKRALKPRSITQGTGAFVFQKSPLLTSQKYFSSADNKDNGAGSSRSSSTARERSSSPPATSRPQRHHSYSHYFKRTFSFDRPTSYIRTLSDMYLRKASSKADIFEARVANEVDNANSSDSEETFVYESNPPEPQRRARHHSRTPSVTSSHSTADQQRSGIRSFGDAMDERRVAGKRSMKFSNNPYNDFESPDGKNGGSMRSHTPRHFGRFGRGGSHASMFDQDSPFTQASKLRSNHLHGSRPNSPRSPQSMQQQQRSSGLFGKKKEPSFDFDAEGGDDERTPLVGTIRTPRSGRLPRRMNSSPSIDEYYGVRRQSRCGRFGGCLLGLVVFTAVILSAVAFLVMSNRPMYEVRIHKIQDVLASEQEIMLDLLVAAVNPNALGITITDMDVNVFAKSTHVGGIESLQEHGYGSLTASRSQTPRKRRRRVLQKSQESTPHAPNYWQDLSSHWHAPAPAGGVDEGTDPDEDLEGDAQTILLGRITHFDQGLSFEGSPLKRHLHYSVGEMRLAKPGNKTETGGSVKWEKVLQYPFQLIIRGVLKYELPISSRMESVSVGANITVYPDEDVDEHGAMRLTPVYKSERLRWIDQDDLEDAVAGIEAVQGGSVVEVEV